MPDHITLEQMLNLADRAERGPLNAAEASRLRAGIAALSTGTEKLANQKSVLEGRLGAYISLPQGQTADALKAVQRLVENSERGGAEYLPVWAVAAASGAPIRRGYPPRAHSA